MTLQGKVAPPPVRIMFTKNILHQILCFGLLLCLQRGFAYTPNHVALHTPHLRVTRMTTTQLPMMRIADLPIATTLRNGWTLRGRSDVEKTKHGQESPNNGVSCKIQGMTKKISMVFVPGKELLTVGSELTGLSFAVATFIKGLICFIKPSLMLKGLGIRDKDREGDDPEPVTTLEFMLNILGTRALSLGLTAGLALRSELSLLGQVPSTCSIRHCIAIGVLPYIFSMPRFLTMKSWPAKLAMNRKKNVVTGWILSMVVWYLFWFQGLNPHFPLLIITCQAAFTGLALVRNPSILFRKSDDEIVSMSPEESLVGRLVGIYSCMYAMLLVALRTPVVNALPAIGLTALTGSLASLYIIYGTKDIENSGASSDLYIASSAVGLAVASAGLRHYLVA